MKTFLKVITACLIPFAFIFGALFSVVLSVFTVITMVASLTLTSLPFALLTAAGITAWYVLAEPEMLTRIIAGAVHISLGVTPFIIAKLTK